MLKLFVDELTVIDCAFFHPQRGLLGQSWIVDLELEGQLDYQGMVLDFGVIKSLIKKIIDEHVDHKLLLPENSDLLRIENAKHRLHVEYHTESGEFFCHESPASACCLIETDAISVESVTRFTRGLIRAELPDNVEGITLRLREESISGPSYQYVHGLKKHKGNCQRIAHGHRSRIEIYQNESRSTLLEHEWAEKWRDIYIGHSDDLKLSEERGGQTYFHYHYTAEQGDFTLVLPAKRCYSIDSDSTVEHLASHITHELQQKKPTEKFTVRAFEGIRKGAISES